ncbi:MAG TPA: class I SAM-dependent methyltransferase [Actinomycetota bacterium]
MKERPVFARFYELLSRAEDRTIAPFRDEVVGDAGGRVLEIGAGNGLNFGRYRKASQVVAVEPQPQMLAKARPRARDAASRIVFVRATAEALPFADGAFDTVVASLVLCSVADPAAAASELRRVLASGGEVRFFEHVRALDPALARRQDLLNRPYGRFAGGCNMNRDTLLTLRRAGFTVRFRRLAFGPKMAPHVLGTARPG